MSKKLLIKKDNIKFKNGDEYTGQIKNSKKHGCGIYRLQSNILI